MFEAVFSTSARLAETPAASLTRMEANEGHRHSEDEYTPLDPSHILVGMLLPIGDTLLATPALGVLRRRFPWAKISVLVSHSNAGILQDNPNVDALVFVTERGSEPGIVRFARGLSEIRKQDYDLIINLSPVGSIVLRMAGRYHSALHVEMPPLWWLVGGRSRPYRTRHAVDHYLRSIVSILDHRLTDEERQPRLYLTARDRSAARRLLREWGLSPANLLIALHVGGDGFNGRKRWAPQRFAAVANTLVERFGAHVLLLGGSEDVALSEEVKTLIPRNAIVVAGRTSLKETGALIEMSALFVGNDSCPLHIAAAVGTPAVGIFGPSNVKQFQPIGKRSYRQRILHADLPCSPCFNFVGNDVPWVPNTCHSFACLNAISSDEVAQAAIELLQDPREQ
ncbi:MAG: glycosyltransferase family 9 protein [Ktedonobacterales bacterium]